VLTARGLGVGTADAAAALGLATPATLAEGDGFGTLEAAAVAGGDGFGTLLAAAAGGTGVGATSGVGAGGGGAWQATLNTSSSTPRPAGPIRMPKASTVLVSWTG
jgi:hypothetical protein